MIIFKKKFTYFRYNFSGQLKTKTKKKAQKMTIMWQFESQLDLVGTTQAQLFIIKQDEPLDDVR